MPGGKALFKGLVLFVFLLAGVITAHHLLAAGLINIDRLRVMLTSFGSWTPLAYILSYVVGASLCFPTLFLSTLGAAVFGPYWGFLYVWIGAVGAANVSFLISRFLGRDLVASVIGERFREYEDKIAHNGFATVLYLRLIYFPFAPMNFGMGLTKVKFRDYLLGTALGIMSGAFAFTFFIGVIREVLASGQWLRLTEWKVLFAASLLLFSFCIPWLIKKLKIGNRFNAT